MVMALAMEFASAFLPFSPGIYTYNVDVIFPLKLTDARAPTAAQAGRTVPNACQFYHGKLARKTDSQRSHFTDSRSMYICSR